MPIPDFNPYGLLPAGLHTASVKELTETLGFSARRQELIEAGLKPVMAALRALGFKEMYVNGSFATCKPSPEDIDAFVVTTLGADVARELRQQRRVWKTKYQVDLYLAYSDLPGACSPADWENFFGHTGDSPRKAKGIVKLMLGGGGE